MARVDRLVIENYRGASTRLQLDFEKDKSVALIFGENGTGKTTIADALDALGNSSKGSLEDRSSTRARTHLPTIGRKPADVRIEVTAGSSSWLTALAGDNLTTSPPGQPKIRVLRRSQLQRLIQAEPARRYEELRRFIDVDAVERAEDALKEAVSDVNASLTSESSKRVEAESQLQQAWEAEGKPGSDAITWAKKASSQDATALATYVRQLKDAQDATSRAKTTLAELRDAETAVTKAKQEVAEVEQEIGAVPGIDAQQAVSLTAVLNHVAQHLLVGAHSDVCPVCMQAISLKTLTSDIQRRLGELKKYDSLRAKRETAVRNVNIADQRFNARRESLLVAAKGLLAILQKAEIAILAGISANDYQELAKQSSADLSLVTTQAEKLIEAFSLRAEDLSAAETTAAKQSGQINLISALHKQVQTSVA
jgi:DNA repair exonuclease SbcCD ATPase subunit